MIRSPDHDSALPADERRRCGGVQKDGTPCRIVMTVDTKDGPRCRYHRSASTGGTRLRPPVRSLRSMEDAARLMSWAAIRVASGELSQTAAIAIKTTVAEWRQDFDAAAAAVVTARFVALAEAILKDERVMAAMTASKDERVRAALRAIWGTK